MSILHTVPCIDKNVSFPMFFDKQFNLSYPDTGIEGIYMACFFLRQRNISE